jgi:glycosyltransferase involved in cell wall biosynthesis
MPDLRQTIGRLLRRAASEEAERVGAGGSDGPRPRPKRRYLADATEGIARVRAAGHDRPMVVATWPLDAQNPFQALLTSRFEEAGIVPIGMDRLADLDDPVALPALVALRGDGVEVVLHLHWLARVLRGAASEAEARGRVASFLAALDGFRAAGGRIAWTAHNVLPHDTRFPDVDVELRRGVVARAELIHVLSEGTVAAAAPLYEIPPEKVVHLPHPAYLGVYPDDVSDADARRAYGLGADDVVFGLVGHLRAYKGLDELLDAFEALSASPPDARRRRLLIAGTPAADPTIEALLEKARAHPDVVVDARRIPADELSLPLRASDVIVLPYRSSLNSGALLLALSFGRPVIAAASPHVSETVGPDASITFEPDDRDALGAALRGAETVLTAAARDAALATARRFDPAALSRRFAVVLRERLGDRGATKPSN